VLSFKAFQTCRFTLKKFAVPAGKCGEIYVDDEIVAVNGAQLANLSKEGVVALILKKAEVTLTIASNHF
jgi:C-terminal processing protease CtpA/Prc